MNRSTKRLFLTLFIPLLLIVVFSCKGNSSDNSNSIDRPVVSSTSSPVAKLVKIESPDDNQIFASGSKVPLVLSLLGEEKPDSVRVYFDGVLVSTLITEPWQYDIETGRSRLGRLPVKIAAYSGKGRPQTLTMFIQIFSDIVPQTLSYSVVNEYPHDRGAYTQGLLVHNGLFYESTGKEGESSIREVEIKTGAVKRQHNLDSKFFGEGLVLLNSRLYQLTWLHNTGFIYDLETFKEIKSIHYDTQGWGLTTDGEKIFMSDGTNKIFFIEPEYFTVTGSIEVYDDKKAVYQLNELEYIDGVLWANIYMTDLIAKIDPVSGKVLAYLNLNGILRGEEKNLGEEEVLNGIAWDSDSQKFYVTGKRWPKLFEIKIK